MVLRLRFDDFERVTRSRSLREPTESTAVIPRRRTRVVRRARPLIRERGATLIGLSLTNLCGHDAVQLVLPFEIRRRGRRAGRVQDCTPPNSTSPSTIYGLASAVTR